MSGYYHPVFLDLRRRNVLIVGGGEVAAEKIRSLIHSDANLTVVSPTAIDAIRLWDCEGVLTWCRRKFEPEDVNDAFMSIGATDDLALNRSVADLAEAQGRLGNSVDDPSHCNFIMAAIARCGSMQVAISSSGNSPALAQRVRDRILCEVLTEDVGSLSDFLGAWRPEVGQRLTTYRERKCFWESVLDSEIPTILSMEGREAADLAMRERLAGESTRPEFVAPGTVYLVGAGPGDPGLLTVRGSELLRQADVVLYDRLVNPAILRHCTNRTECTYVGKALGTSGSSRQKAINQLMIQHAREGKTVVRLKGGDPFVFGRGSEEADALVNAGIRYEVVSGVSSAIAAPAAAGIPLTHRGVSDGFAVFAGRSEIDDDGEGLNWAAAATASTAVFLMGVTRLPTIVKCLLELGRPPDTPVAVVSNGTLPSQQTVVGVLRNIQELASGLQSPAVIVVGEVARFGVADRASLLDQTSKREFPTFAIA